MFPYFGDIEPLADALNHYRPRMAKAYKRVLGNKLFRVVQEADARLLQPTSFRTLQEVEVMSGITTLPSNKFLFAWDSPGSREIEIGLTGAFVHDQPIEVYSGFVFSQEAFEISRRRYEPWIDPYLGPYIHEYDHFVLLVLQRVPMLLAMSILTIDLQPRRLPLDIGYIQELVEERSSSREEGRLAAFLGIWAYVIQQAYEISTRMLDGRIYSLLGFQVSDYYRTPQPVQYRPVPFPELQTIGVIPVGDVLCGTTLEERMVALQEWMERLRPSHEIQKNFIESLSRLNVSKAPFPAG